MKIVIFASLLILSLFAKDTQGSESNIIGLPLERVKELFASVGLC